MPRAKRHFYGQSVPLRHRASQVAVFKVDPQLARNRGLDAQDLRPLAELVDVIEPYKPYDRTDPRRRRSHYDTHQNGNWNTTRTPNPRSATPAPPHPAGHAETER